MELFIRPWSPGPGENPEKVQGLGPGLGENFHRVESRPKITTFYHIADSAEPSAAR